MRRKYEKGFRSLYDVILKNVSTVEDLMKQSEELEKIIISLNNNEKSQTKSALESLKKEISTSIENLMKQTKTLFKAYEDLIEEVFGA